MLKTLYLLRHAKSSWDDPCLADHDRALAPRGRKAAPRMGAYIAGHVDSPRCVLCSTALRARQTWELAALALPSDIPVDYRREIYDAGPSDLIEMVRALPDDADPAMVIGHNPALEDCAARLAGGDGTKALKTMASKYPTAALAVIVFDVAHWRDIAAGDGRLDRFVRPKDLG